jgi:uncharacterized protein YbaA (DUF1428 family)
MLIKNQDGRMRRSISSLERMFKMSRYVDGFVLVVPKGKAEEYKKMAEEGRDSWMKHGALEYFECKSDDLKQQEMGPDKSRSFSEMAGATDADDVWFSFIVFESKEHRDEVNKNVMEEMSEAYDEHSDFTSPFEMSQMAYGGFEVWVEGQKG